MQLHHVRQCSALMPRLSKRKLAAAQERQSCLVLPPGSHTQLLQMVLNGAVPLSPSSPCHALQWKREFLQGLADLHQILSSGVKA